MAAKVTARLPSLLVFVFCLVLMRFFTRTLWITIKNKEADVYQQKGNQNEEIPFLHIVIQFPLLLNDTEFVRKRQLEYIQTLQRNLAHPLVEKVHILCEGDHVVTFINRHFILNAKKIILKNIGRRLLYSDALVYISDELLWKTCIIMNADIHLGKGFEQLDPDILKQGMMYALTRHEDREHAKACPGTKDFCGKTFKYIGSHDAFVMNLVRPLPEEVIQRTDFRPNLVGAENVFIYILKTYGYFLFKNPCSILHVVHNHCSRKRGRDRFKYGQRLEKYLKTPKGLAPFSGL